MKPGDRVFLYHSGGVSADRGNRRRPLGRARRCEESEIGGGRSGLSADGSIRPRRWPRSSSPASSTIGRWCGSRAFPPWRRRRSSSSGCARATRRRRSSDRPPTSPPACPYSARRATSARARSSRGWRWRPSGAYRRSSPARPARGGSGPFPSMAFSLAPASLLP